MKLNNVYDVSITAIESTVYHCTEWIQNIGSSIPRAMGRHNKLDLNHRRQPRSRSRMHDDAQRSTQIHVPNLYVGQQTCTHCLDIHDISIRCNHCGVREYVFKDEPVKQLIDLALAPRKQFKKIVCITHNAQGFDAQFIFKYIVE